MNSNNTVIQNKLKEFMETKVHRDILMILERVASDVLIFIEGAGEIPIDTGNLQDSTGIGIYHEAVLKRYVPRKTAIEPRTDIYPKGLTTRKSVWGTDILNEAISKGVTQYRDGYVMVIFSAMPYAKLINLKTDYFSRNVRADFYRTLDNFVQQFKPI